MGSSNGGGGIGSFDSEGRQWYQEGGLEAIGRRAVGGAEASEAPVECGAAGWVDTAGLAEGFRALWEVERWCGKTLGDSVTQ